jgi:hypothetical protein
VLAGILEIIVQRSQYQFLIVRSESRQRHTTKPNGRPFRIFKSTFAQVTYFPTTKWTHEWSPSGVALHHFTG